MQEVLTSNFQETQRLGKEFAEKILKAQTRRKGAVVVALEGDLGSGKTTFVQGMAAGLDISGDITSPSFVLIKRHRFKIKNFRFKNFYHIDCYRLEKAWQLQELGFEEIINNPDNIVAIEWGERVEEILLKDRITIKFEFIDEKKRKIIFLDSFD